MRFAPTCPISRICRQRRQSNDAHTGRVKRRRPPDATIHPRTPMTTRAPLPPLQTSDFTSAFPNSTKVYVEERGVRVPMREIALTNGERLRVYDTSGPQGCDVRPGLSKLRAPWIAGRRRTGMVTQHPF